MAAEACRTAAPGGANRNVVRNVEDRDVFVLTASAKAGAKEALTRDGR
jgi:hypothetical protein